MMIGLGTIAFLWCFYAGCGFVMIGSGFNALAFYLLP